MQKYFINIELAFKNALVERAKLTTYVLVWIFRIGLLLFLYKAVFERVGGSVGGLGYTAAIWSIAAYFVLLNFGVRRIYRDITNDVRLGTIESRLNKPYHYLPYVFAERFGRGLPDLLIIIPPALIILTLLSGVPAIDWSLQWFVAAMVIFALGTVLAFFLYGIIGLLSFWLQDTESVFMIVDKMVMVLGGSYIPVAMFPEVLQTIARYSPFGATMFVTQIFYPNFLHDVPLLVVMQLVWIVVFALACAALYARANRALSINGG